MTMRLIRILTAAALVAGTLATASAARAAEELPGEFHLCGDDIYTSFKLMNDLPSCAGNGLEIRADNVTIDLDGHTIAKSGDCCSSLFLGIDNTEGHSGLRVRGGAINGFTNAIETFGDDGRFSGLSMAFNGRGIFIRGDADGNVVKGNTIGQNEFPGVSALDTLDGAPDENVITGNDIGNNEHGVEIRGGTANRVTSNRLTDNDGFGVHVSDSQSTVIKRNLVNLNDDTAVNVVGSDGTRLIENTVDDNAAGIAFNNSDGALLRANRVTDNGGHGLSLVNASGNGVTGNKLLRNDHSGLFLGASSNNNVIRENDSSSNTFSGIFVDSVASGNKIIENTTNGNAQHGVEAFSVAKVSRNVAKKNGFLNGVDDDTGLGIKAVNGTTGSKNIAKGNDDPDQCEPSYLC